MKKKVNKVLSKIAIVTFGVMVISQVAFASSNWTDARTYQIKSGADYTTKSTVGDMLGQNKDTDLAKWSVYTVSKTMYTTPSARLVNSSNEIRSDVLSTAEVRRSVTGSVNTGTIGYAEYLSVKPSLFQIGEDTIKLQFKNY